MNNLTKFLSFTLPTVALVSLSYEMSYLWGLGITISGSPISNNDILRGWQQWYIFIAPIFLLTLKPALSIRIFHAFKKNIINLKPEEKVLISSKIHGLMRILGYVLIGLFLFYGEFVGLYLILGMLIFGSDFLFNLKQHRLISRESLRAGMFILLITSIFGFYGFGMGLLDSYKSYFTDGMTIEDKDNSVKSVIRIYENWTLVRESVESYAWLSNQSDKKIIVPTDRYYFLGALCFSKQFFNIHHPVMNSLCIHYRKLENLEDDEDE